MRQKEANRAVAFTTVATLNGMATASMTANCLCGRYEDNRSLEMRKMRLSPHGAAIAKLASNRATTGVNSHSAPLLSNPYICYVSAFTAKRSPLNKCCYY
jgi:hypothetical protein